MPILIIRAMNLLENKGYPEVKSLFMFYINQ